MSENTNVKEEHIAALVELATANNKAVYLQQGQSEEVADAYAVINRAQITNTITQVYNLIVQAGLL